MHLSLLLIPVQFVVCNRYLHVQTDEIRDRLNSSLRIIFRNKHEERERIRLSGKWDENRGGTMVTVIVNSAYSLSLLGVKKLHDQPQIINEFSYINNALLSLDKLLSSKNLTIYDKYDKLKIDFKPEEMFENGTKENSPYSLKYLPIVSALFNENYNNTNILHLFAKGCQEFNPIKLIKANVHTKSITSKIENVKTNITEELLRLHHRCVDEQYSIYAQSIVFAECMALSQKHDLPLKDPLIISEALPHFSLSLNILQRKYLNIARTLTAHKEL